MTLVEGGGDTIVIGKVLQKSNLFGNEFDWFNIYEEIGHNDGALVMPSSFAVVEQDEMSYVNGGGTFSENVRGNAAKLRVAHYFGIGLEFVSRI